MEFFWYDYETYGRAPREDRPVQFAGMRTDGQLRQIGAPVVLLCRPALDYLPDPEACMMHGIAPQVAAAKGRKESDFAARILNELSRPATCVVGYNAMRFDHEITRFLLYRNLRDPYEWHWREGNSRWDIIDLMRAAYALRPEGISWPINQKGKPSFKLTDLAMRNGLLDSQRQARAHDGLSDTRTLVDLARFVRGKQPKMFDYYLGLRKKDAVQEKIRESFVWVSSSIVASRGASIMEPLGYDFDRKPHLYAFDLAHDPSDLVGATYEELLEKMSHGWLAHVYTIKTNASPFVVSYPMSSGNVADRKDYSTLDQLGIDLNALLRYRKILRSDKLFAGRLCRAYKAHREARMAKDIDVDQALYSAFLPNSDKRRLPRMLAKDPTCSRAQAITFEDSRLPELVFRYRARNFADTLSQDERARWLQHCRYLHLEKRDEVGQTAMDRYYAAVDAERSQHPDQQELVDALKDYGDSVHEELNATVNAPIQTPKAAAKPA